MKKTPRVVCAALKSARTRDVVIGVRHDDQLIKDAILQGCLYETWTEEDWEDAIEGFINTDGRFITREEAFVSATENNQIINPDAGCETGRLTSNHIY